MVPGDDGPELLMERLDAFMGRANAAYYARHDPFADFTTAPEISQVFGEILGLWAAVVWQGMGAPDPVLLLEAGPGRGTLMADALRAIGRAVPAFRAALRVHLIETSARLRGVQARVVGDAVWHDGLGSVPPGPLIFLGNEFFDALPIRQFVRRGDVWAERFVAAGRFVEVVGACGEGGAANPSPHPRSALRPEPTGGGGAEAAIQDGTVFERNDATVDFVAALARRFVAEPGAALVLDYGPAQGGFGDSLQALRGGKPADPLGPAGEADLTAHVDFAAIGAAARDAGAAVHGPLPQGVFLARLGLFQRTGVLARGQPAARSAALMDAASRLAEPARMGQLFKVLALCSPGGATPPGFEDSFGR